MKEKSCSCGNDNCLGFRLLHEKELDDLVNIKDAIRKKTYTRNS